MQYVIAAELLIGLIQISLFSHRLGFSKFYGKEKTTFWRQTGFTNIEKVFLGIGVKNEFYSFLMKA